MGHPIAFSAGVIVVEATDGGVTFPDDPTLSDDVTSDDVTELLSAGIKPVTTPPDELSSTGTVPAGGSSERGFLLRRVGKSATPDIVLGFFGFLPFFLDNFLLSIGGGSSSSLRRVRAAVIL